MGIARDPPGVHMSTVLSVISSPSPSVFFITIQHVQQRRATLPDNTCHPLQKSVTDDWAAPPSQKLQNVPSPPLLFNKTICFYTPGFLTTFILRNEVCGYAHVSFSRFQLRRVMPARCS
ncbi:hypothetical protein TNCV_3991901 [Trichonephila clavipes]|uniref:Uncharacterized protein n=1 Tax=Trichonephila clavipes TaxID=2585209 RepID=A0A8X6SXJ1_TRICX|nr:hypothetical protein TNCV_3991901 [Trichonephila clavipes]